MVRDTPDVEFKIGHSGIVEGRPSLILIHGSGGTAASWGAQINPLARYINVIALSLPGHGKTKGPLLESPHEYGRWVEKSIEALRIPGCPFICGMSFGGAVALETVRLSPKRYAGLILISSGATLDSSVEIIGKLGQNWPETARRFINLIFTEDGDAGVKEISYGALLAAGPDILSADLLASRKFDFKNQLKDIPNPCLIIGGEQDRIVPPEKLSVLAKYLPDARLVLVEEAGHMVTVEQYRRVNESILEFVRGIWSLQT